jgi:hypothetical protein
LSGSAPERRDLTLLDAAIDAAKVVDDYVRGVIGLADGRWGGVEERKSSWSQRFFGKASWSKEHQLARSMGASFGPEQLRKAANAADELVVSIVALDGATTATVQAIYPELLAAVDGLPATLRDREVIASSRRLRGAHLTLSSAIAKMNEARTRLVLAEMRAARPPDP